MVTGEILLGIPYYWYYRHYTTPTRYYTTSLYKYTLLLVSIQGSTVLLVLGYMGL